ncbi:MAG: hypothetical protein IPI30_07935 [Saprospiraceae bacterium]|nr:hypothetical protein [Candidatus Vicinibacter affinis]
MTIYLIILFNLIVYVAGWVFVLLNGLRKHVVFAFSWFIFSIYYLLTPLYFYSKGRATIWGDQGAFLGVGENILEYYDEGFLYFGFASLSFLLGYFFIRHREFVQSGFNFNFSKPLLYWLFGIFFFLVMLNFILSGVNPIEVLTGNSEETLFNAKGGSNYLRNFADSLVSCLVIGFLIKIDRKYWLLFVIVSFVLFAMMGFRYRIIMTVIGVLLLILFNYRFSFKKIFAPLALFSVLLYMILFLTINRYNLIVGDFKNFDYNPVHYDIGSTLAEQTRGALDDINIIKYYHTHPNPKHDYGITFTYFIVRALPRAVVGDYKDKLYPPPAFPIVDEAYNLPLAWAATGEAPLHYAYFIIAGGFWFLVLGAFLTGLILSLTTVNRDYHHPKHRIFLVILCMALFQWYTRGYFPQFVDHLVFLLIPYWLYFRFSGHEKTH